MARFGICTKCGNPAKLRKMQLSDEYLCGECRKERRNHQNKERRNHQFDTYESSKTAYERNRLTRSAKQLPDFDMLFDLFSSDCNSFTKIGDQYGFTRERIRIIYRRHFAKIIPRRPDGRTRQKVCIRKLRPSRIISKFRSMLCFIPLIQETEQCGVIAEPVLHKSQLTRFPRISTKLVRLNKHVCLVLRCKSPSRVINTLYWKFNFRKSQRAEFLILQVIQEGTTRHRFFVIPSQLVPVNKMIYIPVNGWSMYHNTKPNIDWLKYEDCWDLLARQHKPATPTPVASSKA